MQESRAKTSVATTISLGQGTWKAAPVKVLGAVEKLINLLRDIELICQSRHCARHRHRSGCSPGPTSH